MEQVIHYNTIKRHAIEAFVILLLVTFLFLLMLRLFDFVFPSGTSLKEVVVDSHIFRLSVETNKQLLLAQDGEQQGSDARLGAVANILELKNIVKRKQSGNLEWNEAKKGMLLRSLDAVQTFVVSNATIAFGTSDKMQLGENSLVILKNIHLDLVKLQSQARLVLSTGRLRSTIHAGAKYKKKFEVEAGDIVTTVNNVDSKKSTDFEVKINPDRSSTITVLSGRAEIRSQGDSVDLKTSQAVTITRGKPIPKPVYQPSAVRTVTPINNTVYKFTTTPQQVEFKWSSMPGADSYDIYISRDEEFTNEIAVERVYRPTFSHPNLSPGTYYWKVRANIGWVEGEFSKINTIKIVKQKITEVRFPPSVINESEYTIRGTTDSDVSRLLVNDVEVKVSPSGDFSHKVTL